MQTATPRQRRAVRRTRRATLRTMRRPAAPVAPKLPALKPPAAPRPRIMLTLADGTARVAPRIRIGQPEQDGILCPFCTYPSQGTACGNPMCDTQLDAAALAARNAQRQAEDEAKRARAALSASLERSRAEHAEHEAAVRHELYELARGNGQCEACLGRSMRTGGKPKLIKHKDVANCPEARRYA